ncbi:MAG: radical SAM protein [Candidatus Woesearchaeota archaeon]
MDQDEIIAAVILYSAGCMLDCVFCKTISQNSESVNFDIKRKQAISELEKLENISKTHKIRILEISGNDPCEYEELADLVKIIKERYNPVEIQLSTHGLKFTNFEFLKKVINAGVNAFKIPLYGASPEIHDAVVQHSGAFGELILVLKYLKEIYQENPKIKIRINTAIVKENQDNIDMLIYFIKKLNFISEYYLHFAGFVPKKESFLEHTPNIDKLRLRFPYFLKLAEKLNINLTLLDIPKCIFNYELPNERVRFINPPIGAYYHFSLKDKELPIYLQKTKPEQCNSCIYFSECPGFYKTYIEFNLFQPKPILG